jgi:hypothetical protein
MATLNVTLSLKGCKEAPKSRGHENHDDNRDQRHVNWHDKHKHNQHSHWNKDKSNGHCG